MAYKFGDFDNDNKRTNISVGKMIIINLALLPPSVNTIWVNIPKGRRMSDKGKLFKQQAYYLIKEQYKGQMLEESVRVSIELYFKTKHKRDIDNYNKAILDSLNGTILVDDSQIVELNVKKYTGTGKDEIKIQIEKV